VPDAVYEGVRAHFSETEIVYLTLTVIADDYRLRQ